MRPAVSTARDLRPWNSVLVIGSPRTLLEMTFLYSRFGNCDRSRRQEPPAAGRRTPGHEPGSHLWGRAANTKELAQLLQWVHASAAR